MSHSPHHVSLRDPGPRNGAERDPTAFLPAGQRSPGTRPGLQTL
ncbi:hypothetical protein SNOG_07640 [Parastagonospora nodorum SN15]|uniref:Uncharacterized protein n=1 Tax=Phaeosphaeria nodorum (strain SN15 / ATCC MYA-4574 / FGSC 10173) TaxID=321614 RepID=Q0UKS4_PHANO|nr:hypothetical protein SNOG_07640 [Parastagonospora nodorum SN15]EAT85106.1 hypothetical protein SNOG_07640 [Parastagonospora nodorum SN15]